MEWLIAANHEKYDHDAAFAELPFIDWKQTANFEVGDTVYVYSSSPVRAVQYITRVLASNIPVSEAQRDRKYWLDEGQYESGIANGTFARLQLVRRLPTDLITFNSLRAHGMTGVVQGPRRLRDSEGNLYSWGRHIKDQVAVFEAGIGSAVDEMKIASLAEGIEPSPKVSYLGKPQLRVPVVMSNGVPTYPRSPRIVANALALANYECEIDRAHPSFVKRTDGHRYMEAHHLIPLEYHAEFAYSLDVEENVICLCSNCHREIHHGVGAERLIRTLYDKRIGMLKSVGLDIDLEQLLCMYRKDG